MPEYPAFFGVGGLQNSVFGPDLASAGTIAPTGLVTNVTGAAAIVTITPPWPGFGGPIFLVAQGIFTWTAAGNIAVAGLSTSVGRAVGFVLLASGW